MSEQAPIIVKKIKKGGHGHHGGSWKVAYADFVTAMMAFFMVMWLMGLSEASKSNIQGYFNDPLGFEKNMPKTRSVIPVPGVAKNKKAGNGRGDDDPKSVEKPSLEKTEQAVKDAIERAPELSALLKDISIKMTDEGLVIELTETRGAVFFESGSSIIRPDAKRIIQKLAPALAKSGRKMIIQGHTDAKPFPNDPIGNLRLSTERAQSLMLELNRGGITPDHVKSVEGLGSSKLLFPDQPYSFANRRVTILLPYNYKSTDSTAMPVDKLKQDLQAGTHPEALEIVPPTPHIAHDSAPKKK